MWSVGPTRFKENTKIDLLSSWGPLCNENLYILRQSPWPTQGGQPSVGSLQAMVGSTRPMVGLSGLTFLIQSNPISWSIRFIRTVIYRYSSLLDIHALYNDHTLFMVKTQEIQAWKRCDTIWHVFRNVTESQFEGKSDVLLHTYCVRDILIFMNFE